jgi:hypothetical protein
VRLPATPAASFCGKRPGRGREKRERREKERGKNVGRGERKNKVAKTGKVAATVAFSLKMVPPPFSDV